MKSETKPSDIILDVSITVQRRIPGWYEGGTDSICYRCVAQEGAQEGSNEHIYHHVVLGIFFYLSGLIYKNGWVSLLRLS